MPVVTNPIEADIEADKKADKDADTAPVSRDVAEQFANLADTWRTETYELSSSSEIAAHPAYQAIIALGTEAVPCILRDMERQPDHWFSALRALTGVNPVRPEQQGRITEMTQAWLCWAKAKGYAW